uniref:Inactive dipeptidyl peptidase 10-like n=1 Tax=Hippocampus comes TaxID=109280 RepID=A0A3Q2ZJ38_HIPCM
HLPRPYVAHHPLQFCSTQQEFVDISTPQRNWKGIAISLLVIVAVCSLITMSVVVLTPADHPASVKSPLTVDDLYSSEFTVHDPEVTWISDSEVVYRNRDNHVVKFDFTRNETQVLLSNTTFVAFKVAKYSLSADLQYALFAYDVKQVGIVISLFIHFVEVWELNPPEVSNAVLQHAAWGKQGQQLIYIFENNIYYQSDVRSNSLRITSSGMAGVIFNGLADWLYEEEILRSHLAHWWSPDGEKLAFLTINDTLVPNMALAQFTGGTYPRGLQYPYPMAGQTNPAVKLSVVNLFGVTHSVELHPPYQLSLRDFYITMVKWISNTHLAVRWLTRAQNASVLTVCDAAVGVCLAVRWHEDSSDSWISRQNQEPLFDKDTTRFFLAVPLRQGGQGDFHHITMFTKKDEIEHITSGAWEVTQIVSYDENKQVMYVSYVFISPFHCVSTLGAFPRQCLTCGLREACTFFEANISPDAEHAILHCKGKSLTIILMNNHPLWSMLSTKRMLQACALSRIELPLKLILPLDFSESFLYGLLLIVGSSPGDQAVTEEFRLNWDWVLVGSEQVIVARLDGRGSAFQGQRFSFLSRYLVKLPYIDPTRVGIFGEDYGGYLALMLIKSTEGMIRCAAAQAPVVDWTMYASAFSERYFGMPSTEENRYQMSKVLPDMKGLQGGTLFLAHGTADANVHFQHSAELIKHLIRVGANYTMQIYPDEGHFLSRRSQIQLRHSLIGYFRGCLLDASSLLDRDVEDE